MKASGTAETAKFTKTVETAEIAETDGLTDGPTFGPTDGPTNGPKDGPPDRPTDGPTDRHKPHIEGLLQLNIETYLFMIVDDFLWIVIFTAFFRTRPSLPYQEK